MRIYNWENYEKVSVNRSFTTLAKGSYGGLLGFKHTGGTCSEPAQITTNFRNGQAAAD